jgi:exopolysaccharide biosynthesis protein
MTNFSHVVKRETHIITGIGGVQMLMLVRRMAEEHGRSGFNANGVRAIFVENRVSNAVFLDCSDSATLYYDGKFLIKPGVDKNEFLTVAVGFK